VKDTSFTVGLQNIAPEDVDKVVNIIEDTLAAVEAEGFPQQRIAAVLHSYELSLKHRSPAVFRIRFRYFVCTDPDPSINKQINEEKP
jgi:Zn-dependent M16 (insulinase) family peptidase